MTDTEPFSLDDHRGTLAQGRNEAHSNSLVAAQAALDHLLATSNAVVANRLVRSCSTGAWLPVIPSMYRPTVLSAQEWRDNLHIRFGITPAYIPAVCDGCGAPHSATHALHCACGGLIQLRHDEVRDILFKAAAEVFPLGALTKNPSLSVTAQPTVMHGQPLHPVPAAPPVQPQLPPPPVPLPLPQPPTPLPATPAAPTDTSPPPVPPASPNLYGDLAIRNLFETGTTAIVDVRVVCLDCASYCTRDATAVLESTEKLKRKKYSHVCKTRRESFHPFVVSADGMLGDAATKLLQRIAQLQSDKYDRPYSILMCDLRQRFALALAKSVHACLRLSRKREQGLTPRMLPPTPNTPPPEFLVHYG